MAYQRQPIIIGKISMLAIKRLKQLEDENRRLKQMFANQSLEIAMLKDIIEKKL